MLFAEMQSISDLQAILDCHRSLAYQLLFFGAFSETLLPFSLVIYGEVFFIAGAVLAGLGSLDIWGVAAVLYGGGILGDNCSYWLGRHYGPQLLHKISRIPGGRYFLRHDYEKKGLAFFGRHGNAAVFLARLCGPLSWFIPALAGSFRLRYSRFVFYNALGVIVGIGEFLIIGYFLGDNLETIFLWLKRLGYIPAGIALILLLIVLQRCRRKQRRNSLKNGFRETDIVV